MRNSLMTRATHLEVVVAQAGGMEGTGLAVAALDWSLWVVRDLSCYLVHHLMILPRPDPPCSTELLGAP